MRHKKKINHLSRQRGHRHAMLANMASSLIVHKRIETTTAKAKALRIFIEPLITKAKDDTTHSRRQVFSYLRDKDATSELFREVAVKIAERPGGYTRIIKIGNRLGDNADMCIMELVDYNENLLAEKAAASKSASRRRRGGKKKTQTDSADEQAKDSVDKQVSAGAAEEGKDVIDESTSEEIKEEDSVEKTDDQTTDTKATADADNVKEEPVDNQVKEEASDPAKDNTKSDVESKGQSSDENGEEKEEKKG